MFFFFDFTAGILLIWTSLWDDEILLLEPSEFETKFKLLFVTFSGSFIPVSFEDSNDFANSKLEACNSWKEPSATILP